jgi:hypothetical protein
MNIKEKYNTLSVKTRAAIKTAAIMTVAFGVPSLTVTIPQFMLPILFFSLIVGATYAIYALVLSDMKYEEKHKK